MKKSFALAAIGCLLAASVPAVASPDNNAPNAADTDSGTFCVVRGSESDSYRADPTCTWHRVDKFSKDGTLLWFRYQDKGTLQPGNVVPETAVQIEITDFPGCTGNEVVTPSGQYSSDLLCKN